MAEYGVTEEFVEAVADEIATMPHALTNAYNDTLKTSMDTNDIWIPHVWNYFKNTTQARLDTELAKYAGQQTRWWYGCTGVDAAPGPTYHLDDILLSPRVMSWMQVEFDITGNLYFCMRQCSDKGPSVDTDPEDYYAQGARTDGFSNGDGSLCFPGMQYNLDMPVATRRLESIRNGIEDYELILALKELYNKQFGDDSAFDAVYAQATKDMYELAHIKDNVAGFNYGKTLIAELLMLANNGVFVQNLSISGGSYEMTLFAKEGKTVTVDGKTATEKVVTGGRTYAFGGSVGDAITVSVDGADAFNSLNLTIKA